MIVEQHDTTVVVHPGQAFVVKDAGNLIIHTQGDLPVRSLVTKVALGGRGYSEQTWGAFMRGQGIATMAIDYFGPRGVIKNSSEQPAPAIDIVDALKVIASDPRIDAKRIGVMGYSRSRIA